MHITQLQGRKEIHLLNTFLENPVELADKVKASFGFLIDILGVLVILLILAALFAVLAFCTLKFLELIIALERLIGVARNSLINSHAKFIA